MHRHQQSADMYSQHKGKCCFPITQRLYYGINSAANAVYPEIYKNKWDIQDIKLNKEYKSTCILLVFHLLLSLYIYIS